MTRMETVLELKHWFVFQFNHLIWLVAFVLWFSGLCGWVPIIMGYKVEDRCSMFPTNTAMHVPECMALLLLRFQYDIGRVVAVKTGLRTAA